MGATGSDGSALACDVWEVRTALPGGIGPAWRPSSYQTDGQSYLSRTRPIAVVAPNNPRGITPIHRW